jgi:hypothetical protein
MDEVIIERPRWNRGKTGKGRYQERARLDPEALPTKERMKLRHGSKELNENLAPLRRFLARRVGRSWNTVHQEISAQLSMASAVQKHVLDHLRQFVELHPVMIDGVPHEPVALGSARDDYRPVRGFYVCPQTGILRATPSVRRWPRKPPPFPREDARALDPATQLHRLEGVWYRITLAPVPTSPVAAAGCFDVVLRKALGERGVRDYDGALYQTYGRRDRYAVAKVQLGSRALKRWLATG